MNSDNPYSPDESPKLILYKSKTDGEGKDSLPLADYGEEAFSFPPTGPVSLKQGVKFKEEEIKGSKGATRIELEGFETAEVSFSVDLITDEQEGGETALEKFSKLNKSFRQLDSEERPAVYTMSYPLTDESGVTLVFFSRLEANDTAGEDHIVVNVTLKEVLTIRQIEA